MVPDRPVVDRPLFLLPVFTVTDGANYRLAMKSWLASNQKIFLFHLRFSSLHKGTSFGTFPLCARTVLIDADTESVCFSDDWIRDWFLQAFTMNDEKTRRENHPALFS
jgi:hypothetical protein